MRSNVYPADLRSFFQQNVKSLSCKANYYLQNYNDKVWLIGDGRSGTTWVADLINHDGKYREMFEPFHPNYAGHSYMFADQYVRANTSSDKLKNFAGQVFSGRLTHPRIDSSNSMKIYKGLLIKDIFANLFAYWASQIYPDIKTILLIRNPFAVALSKYKKMDWFWVTDPMDLLNQADLYEDYLFAFEDVIRKVSKDGDYISKQVLIWSIINYVPLLQFNKDNLDVVFYEKIFSEPEEGIFSILNYIDPNRELEQFRLGERVVKHISRYSGEESTLLTGKSPITSWKNELTAKQIDAGMAILEVFGFGDLYDQDVKPNRSVIDKLQLK